MHTHSSAQRGTPPQQAISHVKPPAVQTTLIRKPPAFVLRRPHGHRPTASTGSLSLASSSTSGTTLADDPFAYLSTSNSSTSPSPKKKSGVLTPLYLPHRALSSVVVPPSPRSLRSVHSHRLASALTTPPRTRTTKRAPPTPAVLSMPSTEPIAMLSPPTQQNQYQQRPSLSPHHSRRSSLTPNPPPDRSTRPGVDSRRPSLAPLSRPNSPEVHREGGRTASRSERLLRDTLRRDERARSQSRVRGRSGSDASMDLNFPRTNSIGEVSSYIAAPTPSHAHGLGHLHLPAHGQGQGAYMSVPPSPKLNRSHTSQALATPATHAHAHPNHNPHQHHQLHLHTPSRPHLAHSPATSPPGALPTGVGLGISPTLSGPMARRTATSGTRSPPPRELNFGPALNGMTAFNPGPVHGHVGCTCSNVHSPLGGPTRSARAARRDSRQSMGGGSGSGPHSRQNSAADMTASSKVSSGTAPLTPPPTPPHTAQRLPPGMPGQLQRRGTGASRASSVDLRLSSSASGSSGSGASSPSVHSPTCPMHNTSPLEQVLAAPFEMQGAAATAPPTPRFDVKQAALQCAAKTGYVAFGDVDGLGVPGSLDEESEREANQGSEARRGRTGMGRGLAKVLAWWHAPVGQGQGPARVL